VYQAPPASAPQNARLVRVAESDGLQIYFNKTAFPAVYLVHQVKEARDAIEALMMVQDDKIDWKTTVVLESSKTSGQNEFSKRVAMNTVAKDRVRLLDRDANNVLIMSDSKTSGVLVLTDTFYPGWSVTVDGKPSKVLAANYAFRGVFVPAGRHFIEFSYRPLTFSAGLVCLQIGLLLSALAMIAQGVREFASKKQKPFSAREGVDDPCEIAEEVPAT
jgi:hypothetical protein